MLRRQERLRSERGRGDQSFDALKVERRRQQQEDSSLLCRMTSNRKYMFATLEDEILLDRTARHGWEGLEEDRHEPSELLEKDVLRQES